MMNLRGAAVCLLISTGCLPAATTVALRADARLTGGTETMASISVPGSWHQSTKGTERAEVTAPDNFTQVLFTITPVTAAPSNCGEFARRAVGAGITGITDRQVAPTQGVADSVDYQLTVPGPVPGPSERVVFGRAACRDGGLVNLSCSTGHLKDEAISTCQKVIASLEFHGVAPVSAPVDTAPPPPVPDVPPAPPAPPVPAPPPPSETH